MIDADSYHYLDRKTSRYSFCPHPPSACDDGIIRTTLNFPIYYQYFSHLTKRIINRPRNIESSGEWNYPILYLVQLP